MADGRGARPRTSGQWLKQWRGDANAHRPSALRNPVHAQHGAVTENAAATDSALPAHDGVDAAVSNIPVGAYAGREKPRRRHGAYPRVTDGADTSISFRG